MPHRRTTVLASALAVAAAGLLATGSPTRADDTGISGGVESMLELSLNERASGATSATVTSTESRTRLSLSQGRTKQRLDDFSGAVSGARSVVHVDRSAGAPDVTVTFGPQGP